MANRYQRHLLLPGFSAESQRRLSSARVAVIGVGGLGNWSALNLALAGVGQIHLFDQDTIRETDLGRQVLFREDDWGLPKVEAAAKRLNELNPDIRVSAVNKALSRETVVEAVEKADLLIDGSDNLAARELLNTALVTGKKPVVFGGALGTSGYVAFCRPGGACYRCLWPEPAPSANCDEVGVWSPLVAAVGSLQASEALRFLSGAVEEGTRVSWIETWPSELKTILVERDPDCPTCRDSS